MINSLHTVACDVSSANIGKVIGAVFVLFQSGTQLGTPCSSLPVLFILRKQNFSVRQTRQKQFVLFIRDFENPRNI